MVEQSINIPLMAWLQMHRQEEEVLFCHSNNCTIHNNNPLIFYN